MKRTATVALGLGAAALALTACSASPPSKRCQNEFTTIAATQYVAQEWMNGTQPGVFNGEPNLTVANELMAKSGHDLKLMKEWGCPQTGYQPFTPAP